MIEVRHLMLIKEISDTGNMTRAAAKLFLTQPSLSYQLKEIESRLGVELFLRINKRMVLTAAGEKILSAASDILPKLQGVEKEIRMGKKRIQEIRVSTHCYTCYHWFPTLMKRYRAKFPNVEINIVTEAMNNTIEYLLQGKIDLALINRKPSEKGIHAEKLFDDEQVLLVPEHHPLSHKQFSSAKDFASENLIIYSGPFDEDFFANQILIPSGVTPRRVTKMQLTEARVELVKAGVGVSVLSKWLVKPFLGKASGIRQLSIGKRGFYRPWFLVTLSQRKNDPYIHQFTSFLKAQQLG
jgi:LysR family transcriptional regulator for metE and metH